MDELKGIDNVADVGTAVNAQIDTALLKLHTAIPAKVVSFNSVNQTVTLQVLIKQVMSNGELIDIPPLMDVPIQYPKGGDFVITYPLNLGDEGIALFSERCIDAWWQSGQASKPIDLRLHDLSDAMFIPGITSVPKAVKSFFTGGLSIQTIDGNTHVRVTNGTIYIKGNIVHEGNTNQTGTLALQGSMTASVDVNASGISLKSHCHSGVASGPSTTGSPV